jgi:hypothetical protein
MSRWRSGSSSWCGLGLVGEVGEGVLVGACLLNHDPSLPAYVEVVLSIVGLLLGLVLTGGLV